LSLLQFLLEGWGKLRRYYLSHYRKRYVQKMLAFRRGECARCGTCCSIMIRCPHLEGDNRCKIYDRRYVQCRMFPIDPRDLRGRLSSCGHYFAATEPAPAADKRTEAMGKAAQ